MFPSGMWRLVMLALLVLASVEPSLARPRFLRQNRQLNNTTTTLNFQSDCGAVADGVSNDAPAFQRCVDQCATLPKCGAVYLPSGVYNFASAVMINSARFTTESRLALSSRAPVQKDSASMFEIVGDGDSTQILWAHAANMLTFQTENPSFGITIADIFVQASGAALKPVSSYAFKFTAGCVRSLFQNVIVQSADGDGPSISSVLDLGNVSDTVIILDCVFWFVKGVGIRIGYGSEVRVEGGRMIGYNKAENSIGIWVTGNNGGVHVENTDVISWWEGMRLDASNGHGSNREIFVDQATFDSSWRGLAIWDSSYVSVSGCWAASSVQDNIWIGTDTNALLVINGGTIFNAGAEGGDPSNQCNGIVVNSGTFQLNGVSIRFNKGRGVWVPNDNVTGYIVNGCKVNNNGIGFEVHGDDYIISSNVISSNARTSIYGPSKHALIVNNIDH